MNDNVLIHFGKLGMKWGHHTTSATSSSPLSKKEQDDALKDFTAKGKAGQSGLKSLESGLQSVSKLNASIQANKKQPAQKRVDLSKLTDAQLQKQVSRLNMEQQYSNLTRVTPQVSQGQKNLEATLSVAGGLMAFAGSAVGIAVAIKTLKGF